MRLQQFSRVRRDRPTRQYVEPAARVLLDRFGGSHLPDQHGGETHRSLEPQLAVDLGPAQVRVDEQGALARLSQC